MFDDFVAGGHCAAGVVAFHPVKAAHNYSHMLHMHYSAWPDLHYGYRERNETHAHNLNHHEPNHHEHHHANHTASHAEATSEGPTPTVYDADLDAYV